MSLAFTQTGLSPHLTKQEISLYRELYSVVGAHYSDPKFNVESLATEMGLLRRQLYRLMDNFNLSPADFILS